MEKGRHRQQKLSVQGECGLLEVATTMLIILGRLEATIRPASARSVLVMAAFVSHEVLNL